MAGQSGEATVAGPHTFDEIASHVHTNFLTRCPIVRRQPEVIAHPFRVIESAV
jgi:hypothetical protein